METRTTKQSPKEGTRRLFGLLHVESLVNPVLLNRSKFACNANLVDRTRLSVRSADLRGA